MEELEIGEYVRSKKGYIAKIKDIICKGYPIKRIIIFMLILLLASSTTYAKARISGARTHSSSKTYTKSSTSKSSSTSAINTKGFNSSGTTSTILMPSWLPFMFLLHGNNYNINGENNKIDYTLSNIAIKTAGRSK